jgi:hypothetical protein
VRILAGALSVLPALALGPIVEHLLLLLLHAGATFKSSRATAEQRAAGPAHTL